ncbi:TolC family protein [Candidatus Deferrimicrobium sp.]|uniref:TolC family protein n=1 Tax=Candidatus Deferrimicrobium sp. TaxID=3060586 RepID=UPI002ED1F7BC
MKIPLLRALPLLLLVLYACPFSAAGADTLTLSIGDAVQMAVEQNLGLQVATYTPAIAETGIRKARAIYDPLFTSLLDHQGSNLNAAPESSLVDKRRLFNFNTSISQLLPSGATASASFTNLWFEDTLGFRSAPGVPTARYAQPQLTLSFSQPLLQGLGREVTERGITTADDATDSAFADWTQQALNTAAVARNQYLVLVKARESLTTQQASLDLAREVQSQNEARVSAGVLAAYQLQDSRLGVFQAQKNLLDAERAERDAADQLRTTLHLRAGTVIVTMPPPFVPSEASESDALRTATLRRPDIVKARVAVHTAEFNEKVSRNLALPSLALKGSGGVTGFDKNYGDAFDDMGSAKYPNWSVGLSFSVPIGNNSARADVAANRLIASQARAQLAAIEESATLEVLTALRALASAQEQIGVTEQGVTAAEVRMDSYLKRQQLGLATTKDVLDVSASLTLARQNYTAARADYQTAFTNLWKATGELLDRQGIRIKGNAIASRTRKETP